MAKIEFAKTAKEDTKEFFSNTSAHGLPRIASATHPCSRTIWVMVFLVCLGAFSYQAYEIAQKYLRNEKIVSVELRFENIPFPAVTICNLNPYKNSLARQIAGLEKTLKAFESAMGQSNDGNVRLKRSIESTPVEQVYPLIRTVYAACSCPLGPTGECFLSGNTYERCYCTTNRDTGKAWPCYSATQWSESACGDCVETLGTCAYPPKLNNHDNLTCLCQNISRLCVLTREWKMNKWMVVDNDVIVADTPDEEPSVASDQSYAEASGEYQNNRRFPDDTDLSRENIVIGYGQQVHRAPTKKPDQYNIPLKGRWIVLPVQSACQCSSSSHHNCMPNSVQSSGSSSVTDTRCICMYDSVLKDIWPCSPLKLWDTKRCEKCSSYGYCAYPHGYVAPGDETFWSTPCVCHKVSMFCVALESNLYSANTPVSDLAPVLENLDNHLPIERVSREKRELIREGLQPAYISCDCTIDDGDCIPHSLNKPPSANDTLCLCFYNPAGGQIWPCYPSDQWAQRKCFKCFSIGSCDHVTDTDPEGDIPCMCIDVMKMCVKLGQKNFTTGEVEDGGVGGSGDKADSDGGIVKLWEITTEPPPTPSIEEQEFIEAQGFQGMSDPVAIVTKAKENMVFAMAELSTLDLRSISYTASEFITKCSFNGKECHPETDFESILDPNFGNCFTFNAKYSKDIKADRAGPSYGLRLELLVNTSDYLPTTEARGVRIALNPQGQHPFPDSIGYSAPTGFISSFGIHLKQIDRLPAPYGDCVVDGKSSDYIYNTSDYSVEGCHRSCLQKLMAERCTCGDPRFPKYGNTSNCPAADPHMRRCLQNVLIEIASLSGGIPNCICKQPCNQLSFSASFSSSSWPAGPGAVTDCPQGFTQQECVEYYRNEASMVEIYFEQLNYEHLKESEAYGVPNLLADFGGQLGLWLGISVLTCMELFVYVWTILTITCRKKGKEEGGEEELRTNHNYTSLPFADHPFPYLSSFDNNNGNKTPKSVKERYFEDCSKQK